MTDKIRPSHYKANGIEVIDIIEAFELDFNRGNAIKYLLRAGRKDGESESDDLRKATWYVDRALQRITGKTPVLKEEVKKPNHREALALQETTGHFRVIEVSVEFPCGHIGTFTRDDLVQENTVECYICSPARRDGLDAHQHRSTD